MAKYAAGLHATILAGVVVSILVAGAYVFADPSEADSTMRDSSGWAKVEFGLAMIGAQAIVFVASWLQKQRRQDAELSLRQFNEQIEIATATVNLGLWSWCPMQDRVWMMPHCRKMLALADNGGGTPDGLHDRLFEPSVTTRSRGLGLGRTISRSIPPAHGGGIWGENKTGGGAVFGFSLPAFQQRVAWIS